MTESFSRRHVLALGGAAGAASAMGATGALGARPAAAGSAHPGGRLPMGGISLPVAVTGDHVRVLYEPLRLYDSRFDDVPLGRRKLASGEALIVTVVTTEGEPAMAAWINVTVTRTEGSGWLVIRGSDLTGERPLPKTSNINWWGTGQTLANSTLTTVGGENGVEVHCFGGGRTHVIVDLQGYLPFEPV